MIKKNDVYAVVMAGGKGERFWPQSRSANPKPLLRLVGDLTLIELTVERLKTLVPPENIIVITNVDYVEPMKSLLSFIPKENIIGEPVGRDTAPCLALAASIVKFKSNDKNAVMIVLPADHIIKDNAAFIRVLSDSARHAAEGRIVTIGVNPDYPSTGFGYIHCGQKIKSDSSTAFYDVLGFKEKPDAETARKFVSDKSYRWNSGIFLWSVSAIMSAFKKYAPELSVAIDLFANAASRNELTRTLEEEFPKLPKISIDYAVMEKVGNIIVAEADFYWDDVGSWTALRNQIRPSENGNVVRGMHSGLGTENCIIVSESNHLIATIDVKDLIIVHTDDVTLVCHTQSAQRIKELVQKFSEKPELSKYL